MPLAGLHVEDLADHPECVPQIARWMWESWDRSCDLTLEQSSGHVQAWCQHDAVPCGIIARDHDLLVGCMALLATDDIDTHPDLGPWLGCQYVESTHRGRGVASAMTQALMDKARQLKLPKIYMWTEHNPAIYERLGWRRLFQARVWNRLDVTVFNYDL